MALKLNEYLFVEYKYKSLIENIKFLNLLQTANHKRAYTFQIFKLAVSSVARSCCDVNLTIAHILDPSACLKCLRVWEWAHAQKSSGSRLVSSVCTVCVWGS